MPVTILLVDQLPIVREGLKAALQGQEDIRVIGETDNEQDAIKEAERLLPDLLIIDMMTSGFNGLDVTRQVRQRLPHTQVIVLSMSARTTSLLEALRSGAAGYVLAEASVNELVQAIRDVAAGQRYLSASLVQRLGALQAQRILTSRGDPYETLTTREREVLHLVAMGRSNTEIASALHISPRTVETHRANLRAKLGLHTQAELRRYAVQHGLVAPDRLEPEPPLS